MWIGKILGLRFVDISSGVRNKPYLINNTAGI